ncbi:MAG: permease [Sedimentisphaerales bacterium]
MSEFLKSIAVDFWTTVGQMSPYLLFGFAVAGILKILIPTSFIRKHLSGKGIWPVFWASLFGVPLPLCSCGVIPVAMSLHKQGAGKGATIAFLLSTPQTGVDSILVTLSLLGPVFMVARPIIALITGVLGGVAVDLFDRRDFTNAEDRSEEDSSGNKSRLVTGFRHAFVVLPRDIGTAMLTGLIIAAVISVILPDNFFSEKIGTGIGSMILMMMVGIPLYVCATASVPIAAALIAKGLSPGAALVFLMTGPATNAAGLAIIWKILGHRTAVIYLLTIALCALASGLLLNAMFSDLGNQIHSHFHKMSIAPYQHISAVILLIILGFGIYKKYKK